MPISVKGNMYRLPSMLVPKTVIVDAYLYQSLYGMLAFIVGDKGHTGECLSLPRAAHAACFQY